ncbi:MAG: chemotaxis protein CheB [Pseudomonadota bacterium]
MLPLLVGIGASAGGLDALRHFINGLPPDLPAAMVIAQHLSPTHTSLLTELLARDTRFKIIEIEDGTPLHPACLYVTPPNCDVEVQGEILRLLTPENPAGAKPSINRLFSSMAISAQAQLRVGLVLSGTGSDGAKGLAELRRAGGIALVQTLETCAYDGMPRAALESGAADLTLDPSQVGHWLARQLSDTTATAAAVAATGPLPEALLDYVRDAAGLDLSGYKSGTLQRRLARRMALRGVPDTDAYLALLRAESQELRAFVQDVFISVTEFFRDAPTIERLRLELLTRLSEYRETEPFRVWIPGCASGEEGYTVAILIEECLREQGRALDYRVFCTDIAQRPLDVGRAGSYDAASLSKLAPALRDRYFEPEADGRRYRITRRVRDRLVFSIHDVTVDAPFSRLDLVSCRNVLIYFFPAACNGRCSNTCITRSSPAACCCWALPRPSRRRPWASACWTKPIACSAARASAAIASPPRWSVAAAHAVTTAARSHSSRRKKSHRACSAW